MKNETPVPLIRCQLDGTGSSSEARFVPAAEFDLWRHLMKTKHARNVSIDEVSVWVPDASELLGSEPDAEALEPVLRVRFDKPGPGGAVVPVERYLPAETYPQAKAALLAHFDPRCWWDVEVTPGYFLASSEPAEVESDSDLEMAEAVA